MVTRRRFVIGLSTVVASLASLRSSSSAAASSSSAAAPSSSGASSSAGAEALRLFRVRGRTLLVDLGGRRVLVDPCFAPDLGAAILYRAAAPSIEPEETGDVDVICVSAHEPGAFDASSTRRLRGRSASCFVSDEATAKTLRFQGYTRVRVVAAGDTFVTRDVTVRASPSGALLGGPSVGFHLERNGRALWHAGSPPPLDVASASAQFARDNPADVVAVSALGLAFAGASRTVDREDALLLAALARARYAVFLDDDVGLSVVGGLVLKSQPGRRRPPPGARVRPIVVEQGRWYRVLPH